MHEKYFQNAWLQQKYKDYMWKDSAHTFKLYFFFFILSDIQFFPCPADA